MTNEQLFRLDARIHQARDLAAAPAERNAQASLATLRACASSITQMGRR